MQKRRARPGEAIAFFRAALAADTTDCILWPFGTGSHGYSDIKNALDDEVHTCGHRAVCVIKHGDRRKEDLEAAHLCGHRLCINWRHIEWATPEVNNRHKRGHGRQTWGEDHPAAKLSRTDADAIRASTESARVLGKRYDIHPQQVWNIRNGVSRKDEV